MVDIKYGGRKTKSMIKLVQTLLIALILTTGIANAQTGTDIYEYATVFSGFTTKPVVYVSFSSGEYKEVDFDKNEVKAAGLLNQTTSLKYIAQMNKEGWEVVSSQPFGIQGAWSYFLKRKQK